MPQPPAARRLGSNRRLRHSGRRAAFRFASLVILLVGGACIGLAIAGLGVWWLLAAVVAIEAALLVELLRRLVAPRKPAPVATKPKSTPIKDRVAQANATVTVIIPAYNEAARVSEAIASVRAQRYRLWRCVVVDDCSTDDTARVALAAAAGDPRISVVRLQRNSGLSAARNAGLLRTRTEMVVFLDADDVLLPGALRTRMRTFREKNGLTGVYGSCQQVNSADGWTTTKLAPRAGVPAFVNLFTANGENPFAVHEVLMSARAALELGGFDESLTVGCEDVDFWQRSLRSGHEFGRTGLRDCFYVQTPTSMVSKGAVDHMVTLKGLLDRGWAGDQRLAEVDCGRDLSGPLGDLMQQASQQLRTIRSLGTILASGGSEDDIDAARRQLAEVGPPVLSTRAARSQFASGVRRSLTREQTVNPAVVSEAALGHWAEFGPLVCATEKDDLLPQLNEPAWAVLITDRAQAVALIHALANTAERDLPAIVSAESLDAEQGALDVFRDDARDWNTVSLPVFLLRGVGYASLAVPEPQSWVGALAGHAAVSRGSEIVNVAFPWSAMIDLADDNESDLRPFTAVDGQRIELGSIADLARPQPAAGVSRAAATLPRDIQTIEVGVRGSTGDYEGLVEPSIDQLMALKDIHRGERVVIIGNGPSLNETDLGLLAGVHTFGVNGIFYAKDRLPGPLSYYVVEDTMVFKDNTEEILAFSREAGTTLLPTSYKSACPGRDDIVFFRMNGGFYNSANPNFLRPRFSTNASNVLYCGQSVTLINLQLAYWMGFSEVALIGMDFSYSIPQGTEVNGISYVSGGDDPNHFDPRYFGAGKTWKDPKLNRVLANYQLAKAMYESDGRRILNSTPGGKLEAFDRVALADFVRN